MKNIRLLRSDEYQQAAELANLVFGKTDLSPMETAFPKLFSPALGQCFGAVEDGKLVAFMGLVPSFLRIHEAKVKTYSLGSVCTHPDYRGRGYASRILAEIRKHIEEAGASLLFVSGDRPLYRRFGCVPFGSVTRLVLDESSCGNNEGDATRQIQVRELRETDWFDVKEIADKRTTAFEQSLWDLADLIHAQGYAGLDSLTHHVLIAQKNGKTIGFCVIGVPHHPEFQKAVAIEWGGTTEAVVRLLTSAVDRYRLSSLEVNVPYFDEALPELLPYAQSNSEKNEGTVCMVNSEAFIQQLRPYLEEKDAEVNKFMNVETLGDGHVKINLQEESTIVSQADFVSIVFDSKIDTSEWNKVGQTIRSSFFPIPCPNLGALNYV
ncbi:MAG TPA: GNAT family N-acetyltransferase [Bacillales bacterium]|nr:GNAT family N-acetyltransferase [Bacillales bacterium]